MNYSGIWTLLTRLLSKRRDKKIDNNASNYNDSNNNNITDCNDNDDDDEDVSRTVVSGIFQFIVGKLSYLFVTNFS